MMKWRGYVLPRGSNQFRQKSLFSGLLLSEPKQKNIFANLSAIQVQDMTVTSAPLEAKSDWFFRANRDLGQQYFLGANWPQATGHFNKPSFAIGLRCSLVAHRALDKSHLRNAIRSLCKTCFRLDEGTSFREKNSDFWPGASALNLRYPCHRWFLQWSLFASASPI